MTKVYIYIMGANANPNKITCIVPQKINEKEIFFGPCMPNLRYEFRRYVETKINQDIYIVGLNSAYYDINLKKQIRKILWVGKLRNVMTFEEAYNLFKSNKKFNRVFNYFKNGILFSPLHVEPFYAPSFTGYKKRGQVHEDNWVEDLIIPSDLNIKAEYKNDILKIIDNNDPKDAFKRDSCFLIENIYFAETKGLNINKKIIEVLKIAQNEVNGIDEFAVFGRDKNDNAIGRRGTCLILENDLADHFISLIIQKRKKQSSVKNKIKLKSKCNIYIKKGCF